MCCFTVHSISSLGSIDSDDVNRLAGLDTSGPLYWESTLSTITWSGIGYREIMACGYSTVCGAKITARRSITGYFPKSMDPKSHKEMPSEKRLSTPQKDNSLS